MTENAANGEPSSPGTSATIVVGATSKPGSRRAIEWAVARAVSTGARLELFSVIGGAVGAVGEQEVVQRAVDYEEAFLRNEAASLSARPPAATTDARRRANRSVKGVSPG